jgi:hypothetical protein
MKKFFTIFLLLSFHLSFAQKNNNIINVPKGGSLISDNTINNSVWKSAKQINIGDGNCICFVQNGDYLFIGFRGNYEPWSHLYINNRSNVYVLHVTASMGRIIYNMNHYGTWQPDRQFNWKLRKNGSDYEESGEINPDSFFEKEGWITCINSEAEKKEVVYKINLKNYDRKNMYIAFVFGSKDKSYLYWPETLKDDTLRPEIFTGYNPSPLMFDFRNWTLLKLTD